MSWPTWAVNVLNHALTNPEESFAAYCRWESKHPDTLRKFRLKHPEYDEELQRRRQGIVGNGDGCVSFEQFVRDPAYLGLGIRGEDDGGTVLPVVFREAETIVEGKYSLILLTGSLGSGKTYCASLCMAYYIYRLLAEPTPHQRLGLDPGTKILFVVQAPTQKKARANDFETLRSWIINSEWFRLNAPIDERKKSTLVFLNRNIECWPVGGDPGEVLGMNTFSALVDEANFYDRVKNSTRSLDGRDYDQARAAFESVLRRQHSRFDAGIAGPIFIASSKRYKGQFTDEIFEEFRGSGSLFVYDHTTWSSNPQRYENKKWFRMFIGDRVRPPRIITDDETIDPLDESYIIEIPEDFKRAFRRDPVGALQEIAGVSTEISGGFFSDSAKLHAAASLEQVLMSGFDATEDATRLLPQSHSFVLANAESPRHVHADLALTTDNAGIAIGHIAEYDERGLPVIYVDAIARIHPPQVGQIDIDSFYRIVAAWKSGGIPIRSYSADGYQSSDLLQRIGRLGLRAGRISADQTEPNNPMGAYECLRNAINEGRFFFPDDEETVEDMKLLQIDYSASRGLGKVDHLPGLKKDTADCLAAIAWHLTHQVKPYELVGKVKNAAFAAAVATPKIGGTITGYSAPGLSAMDEIRLQRGMPLR